MGRLVVTGATGFIGGRLVDKALDRGFEVIALLRDPYAMPQKSNPGLQVKRWQAGEVLPEIRGAQALCHLAAFVPSDFSDPEEAATCFETNVIGAIDLVSQAANQGISKIIYFSSGQIYSSAETCAQEHSLAYPVDRATYYLASKLAGELCIQAAARRRGIDVVVFRLASIYGPGMHSKGMIPNFIRRLSAGEPINLMDGGAYHVDFGYIEDVVDVTFRALASNSTGIFNVGSGVASTALEVAAIVADVLGADRNLIVVEGEARPNGFAALDVSKARDVFGFKPKRLEEGITSWLRGDQDVGLRK